MKHVCSDACRCLGGKPSKCVFSPRWLLLPDLSSRSTILPEQLSKCPGEKHQNVVRCHVQEETWAPRCRRNCPHPQGGVQRPTPAPDERGPPSPAPLGPAEPFLPAVCLCTWLDRFRCDWGKGAVCLAVKFLGTREDEGRKCQSPLAWQSLGKKGPREGSALLRVPVWRLGVSFKQGLVEHVWILPSEQTG